MIEHITHNNELYAIIIPNDFDKPGIHFFTPPKLSQQLAYMNHPAGKIIEPHFHNIKPREIQNTLEVLFLKKGKLRVNFYDEEKTFISHRILAAGDVIMLIAGGHGFEILEEIIMIEVKQGPYMGNEDKVTFKI